MSGAAMALAHRHVPDDAPDDGQVQPRRIAGLTLALCLHVAAVLLLMLPREAFDILRRVVEPSAALQVEFAGNDAATSPARREAIATALGVPRPQPPVPLPARNRASTARGTVAFTAPATATAPFETPDPIVTPDPVPIPVLTDPALATDTTVMPDAVAHTTTAATSPAAPSRAEAGYCNDPPCTADVPVGIGRFDFRIGAGDDVLGGGGRARGGSYDPIDYLGVPLLPPPTAVPAACYRRECWAVLRVFVDASGRTGAVRILVSSGSPRYDRALLDHARRWDFHPRRIDGRAVDGWAVVPVRVRRDFR